ncbi:hypothetical protein [Metabacillus litoralis]|uniref:hypothetical protein n=1 Tax=Metabacillus TaxID=2675233 RepID=UPI0013CE9918|nr:hypothetical protein [Metabacillus litoralis]MCM3162560.1 hypothetical protein [Metabacillus litoralis]
MNKSFVFEKETNGLVIGLMNITIGEMHLSIDLTEIYFRYEGGEGTVPQVI